MVVFGVVWLVHCYFWCWHRYLTFFPKVARNYQRAILMFKQIFLIRLPMISLLVPHTHVSEYINIANGFKTLKPYIFHIFHIMHTTPRMYTACVIYVYIYSYTLRMSIYLPFGNQTWQSNMLFETVYINGVSQFNPIAPQKKNIKKTC